MTLPQNGIRSLGTGTPDGSMVDVIVDALLPVCMAIDEDKRVAVAKTLTEAIKRNPNNAIDVVARLLEEQNSQRWKRAVVMLKIVLRALGDISDHADCVVRFLEDNCKAEDDDRLDLTLVALKHAVKGTDACCDQLLPVLDKAFNSNKFFIREQAFFLAGALVRHQPKSVDDDIVKRVVEAVENDEVWQSRRSGLDMAASFLAAGIGTAAFVDVCQKTLHDPDNILRERAGRVIAMAISSDVDGSQSLLIPFSNLEASKTLLDGTAF